MVPSFFNDKGRNVASLTGWMMVDREKRSGEWVVRADGCGTKVFKNLEVSCFFASFYFVISRKDTAHCLASFDVLTIGFLASPTPYTIQLVFREDPQFLLTFPTEEALRRFLRTFDETTSERVTQLFKKGWPVTTQGQGKLASMTSATWSYVSNMLGGENPHSELPINSTLSEAELAELCPPIKEDENWAFARCAMELTKRRILSNSKRMFAHRGEDGAVPILKSNFEDGLLCPEMDNKILAHVKKWNTATLSACWSMKVAQFFDQFSDFWRESDLTTEWKTPQSLIESGMADEMRHGFNFIGSQRESPFDFEWGGYGSLEGGDSACSWGFSSELQPSLSPTPLAPSSISSSPLAPSPLNSLFPTSLSPSPAFSPQQSLFPTSTLSPSPSPSATPPLSLFPSPPSSSPSPQPASSPSFSPCPSPRSPQVSPNLGTRRAPSPSPSSSSTSIPSLALFPSPPSCSPSPQPQLWNHKTHSPSSPQLGTRRPPSPQPQLGGHKPQSPSLQLGTRRPLSPSPSRSTSSSPSISLFPSPPSSSSPSSPPQLGTHKMHFESIPLNFTNPSPPLSPRVLHGQTSPTSLRNEYCSKFNPDWKSNAIANLYWIRPRLMEKEGGAGILGGMGGKKWLCNMYRHAIVGYRDHSLEILKNHCQAWLEHALTAQRLLGKPLRFVSHNLVNQKTSLYDGELQMMERQNKIFRTIFGSIGTSVSFTTFVLPLNSDQSFFAISDSDKRLNFRGSLMYLRWIAEDLLENVNLFSESPAIPSETKETFFSNFSPNSLRNSILDNHPELAPEFREILEEIFFDTFSYPTASLLQTLISRITNRENLVKEVEEEGAQGEGVQPVTWLQPFLFFSLKILGAVSHGVWSTLGGLGGDFGKLKERMQTSEIAVNLFRVLMHCEIYDCNQKHLFEFEQSSKEFSPDYLSKARRRFTRVTSIYCLSLLDYILGVAVFFNCKSGLDRTGLYAASSLGVIALWELYPGKRWDIHLSLINYNALRGRIADANPQAQEKEGGGAGAGGAAGGIESKLSQLNVGFSDFETIDHPDTIAAYNASSVSSCSSASFPASPSSLTAFCPSSQSIVSILEGGRAGKAEGSRGESGVGMDKNTTQGGGLVGSDWIVVSESDLNVSMTAGGEVMKDGKEGKLEKLAPFVMVLRNFIYCYLMEVNSVVTVGSTGVRGHKYRNHPILGHLIPYFVKKEGGQLIILLSKVQMTRIIALTKEGENQLVDCSACRKS